MIRWRAVCLAGAVGILQAWSQAPERITAEGGREIRWLDRLCLADQWYPVEECRSQVSARTSPWGGKTLHLYFGIDHHGGEKAYPIGWPRAHCNLQGSEGQWEGWDRFEFMVLVETSRQKLPGRVLLLEIGEKPNVYTETFDWSRTGQWLKVSLPIAEIAAGSPLIQGGIKRLRFVVSESDYRDKDVVEFHLGGFRLTRSLECEVSRLSAAAPVIYSGQPFIRLQVTVVGPPAKVKRGVPFTIRQGSSIIRREMLPLGAGRQIYDCDISELELPPGDYELIVFEEDDAKRKSVPLKMVGSPWQQD